MLCPQQSLRTQRRHSITTAAISLEHISGPTLNLIVEQVRSFPVFGFTRCNAALTPIRPPPARLTAGGGHRARAPTQVVVQGLDDDAVALTARQRGLRRKPRQQRRLHPRHGVHVPRLAGAARQPPIREPLSHTPSAEGCRYAAAAQQLVHYPSWMQRILLYCTAFEHAAHKSCPILPYLL